MDAKKTVDLEVDAATGELGVPDADPDADNPGPVDRGCHPGGHRTDNVIFYADLVA
ncbi:hypothetical protein [Streptomyces sp. NPDC051109]|uniref:hypothetical protein n=1 Tax=Streptomyces sp. NPDC051109 TaxID=3365642 RepID=UPI0037B1916B